MRLVIKAIENAHPVDFKVCKRHELNNFRMQSEARTSIKFFHVVYVVHIRPVDYEEAVIFIC